MKITLWILFIVFAVAIGLYPLVYAFFDMSQGLLATKPPILALDEIWDFSFFIHISTGGLALLIGWSQFVERFRVRYLRLHRFIGKTYVIAVLLSGISGLYIAAFATGGIISIMGFGSLAIAWLFTTVKAYTKIRKGEVDSHERWMIRSYALCFAAVTLRVWLPLMQFAIGLDFFIAYRIVAWLCWVPNLVVAEILVGFLKKPLIYHNQPHPRSD